MSKLRAHLRTRRLTSIEQAASDRVLILTFGHSEPEKSHYLVLEFFAAGNILLLDGTHKIIALFRSFQVQDEGKQTYQLGRIYESVGQSGGMMTRGKLVSFLEKEKEAEEPAQSLSKFKSKKSGDSISRSLLSLAPSYGPTLIEHLLCKAAIDHSKNLNELRSMLSSDQLLEKLLPAFEEADAIVESCRKAPVKSYVFSKNGVEHDQFQPFLATQLKDLPYTTYDSFNQALDAFFSTSEASKMENAAFQRQKTAENKLAHTKKDIFSRIEALQGLQEANRKKAEVIELHAELIDECIDMVSTMLSRSTDWLDIERLVRGEARRGNKAAQKIVGFKFSENKITLALAMDTSEFIESDFSDESDTETKSKPEVVNIDVNLNMSARANAGQYYGVKKAAAVKEQKTMISSEKALENAERKIAADLEKEVHTEKHKMRPLRKVEWFEKFFWFISTDRYIVLGGKDAQQRDMLITSHFTEHDVLVNTDTEGSNFFIIKNRTTGEIAPSTLIQAGVFSLATSTAWEAKHVTSAYWVGQSQVKLFAPQRPGQPSGQIDISGSKNYLPPSPLVLGIGLLWIDSENSEQVADVSIQDGTAPPSSLIWNPKDNGIAHAIPMCAPYAAFSRAKFKVKIQPGNMKKGKVARAIIDHWRKMPISNELDFKSAAEHDIIDGLREEAIIGCIPVSKLKVTLGKAESKKK